MPVALVYLDECVRQRLAPRLRVRGFQATTARDEGMLGAEDEAHLAHATQRGFVIVSHNTRHFRRLHRLFRQQGRPHGGIILLPLRPLPQLEIRVAMMLDWIALRSDYRSELFRWHDLQYWLTQGNRLAGYSEVDVRLALGQRA